MNFYDQIQEQTLKEKAYLLSSPMIVKCLEGDIVLEDYVSFLIQAYHHVKHTLPLLMATGAKLPESKEWLRTAIAHYISEELGHQEWILDDIASCGFDKEKVRASKPNFSTQMMVSFAYDSIARINPLSFFGMVNVLEGTSVTIAHQAAKKIQTTLKLPNSAFSYLFSHGQLDISHIEFFKGLMNKITEPEEKNCILDAAQSFYILYANIFRELSPEQCLRFKTERILDYKSQIIS